ncbi:MAG: hypothetical protein AAF560_08200 [Acidobacteriota bacterium]
MKPRLATMTLALALLSSLWAASAQAVPIPTQTHGCDPDADWKQDLHDYLSTLNHPSHFDLGSPMPSFIDPSTLFGQNGGTGQQRRQVEAIWLMAQREIMPATQMMNIPPVAFTLDYMETASPPIPAHGLNTQQFVVQPHTLGESSGYGFLFAWDYDGNPYFGMPEMRNRAAAVLALDLIMIDQQHKTRDNNNLANYVQASISTHQNCQLPSGAWTSCLMIPPDYQDASLNGIAVDLASCGEMPNGLWLNGSQGPHPPRFSNVSYPNLGLLENFANTTYNTASGFSMLVSSYYAIRPGLPANAVSAFDRGFVRLAERLSLWGSFLWPPQFNRSTIGALGLYLVQHMTGSPIAQAAYESYAGELYSGPNAHFNPAGYFRDDGAWDAGYNTLNIQHTCRLARLEQELGPTSVFQDVLDACHQLNSLRAHLTIRDPDGVYNFRMGPNLFNTRTPRDAHSGQILWVASPFNGIATGDPWAYAEFAGWDPLDGYSLNHITPTAFQVDYFQAGRPARLAVVELEGGKNQTGHVWHVANPTGICSVANNNCYEGVRPWEPYNFGYYRLSYEALMHQVYHQGSGQPLFEAWADDLAQNPDLELYPVERPGDRVEVFGDDFMFAKEGQLSSMIHVGRVAGGRHGFGGGGFSYLFDDDGGAVILTRRRNNSGNLPLTEDISEWWRWAQHTIWLQTPAGLTSAAGNTWPTATMAPGSPTSIVKVAGDIPATYAPYSAPALTTPVPYLRQFAIDDNVVKVTTEVGPGNSQDSFLDVVETLPLNGLSHRFFGLPSNLGMAWEQSVRVEFVTSTGSVFPMNGQQEVWFDNVREIRYRRLGGGIAIELDQPTRVKLADTYVVWASFFPNTPQDGAGSSSLTRTRNVVFDLLHRATGVESGSGVATQLPAPVNITYKIRPFP